MSSTTELIEKHSLKNDLIFRFKMAVHTAKRSFKNLVDAPLRFSDTNELKNAKVIAVSESELWNAKDNQYNWFLTAGKIENLRVAARNLNGIEVKANKVFSFWKHIGKPTKRKGYVVGREIREGCIVPTIAGGLCQMSNALYDAALKAGFEIVERHKHTRVIQGSLAEKDRDATVKWNYVDLRFKSKNAFRIEIEFTADKLLVKFRSQDANLESNETESTMLTSKINDCYSCGNTVCFKHPGKIPERKLNDITAYILDEKSTEFETYLATISKVEDYFIVPFSLNDKIKINRFLWDSKNDGHTKSFAIMSIKRSLHLRLQARRKKNIPSLLLSCDEKIVRSILKMIPSECTHIVVSQNLLPFAYKYGLLWGRTYDVLMTRLPIEHLQARLDVLKNNFPQSITAADFRVNQDLLDLEKMALNKARKLISPHSEIVKLYHHKAVQLDWQKPAVKNQLRKGDKIIFPASALARKGAFEMRQLLLDLNLSIHVLGKAQEHDGFWKGINIRYANNLEDARLLVLPAYVEHHPKLILRALAMGIPVITTAACGLNPQEKLIIVPVGDYKALKEEVQKFLNRVEGL